MAFDVKSARDKKYLYSEQGAWGTAVADNAAVIELDCEHFVLPVSPNVRESPQVHASRNALQGDVQFDTKGVSPELTITMDAKQKFLDHLLHAIFQQVTEVGTTPYKKTFAFPAAQPDFTAIATLGSAGYLATIFEQDPVAANSYKIKNCIAKSITLSLGANNRLKVGAAFVGMGAPVASTPSGTATRTAFEFWYASDIARRTINFGGGAQTVQLKDFELKLDLDIEGFGQDGAGNYLSWAIKKRSGTFKLGIVKDANLVTARTNLAAGTPVTVNLGWGNATPGNADGDLDITFQGKLKKAEGDNQDIYGAALEGDLLAPDASTSLCTIILANATQRSW